LTLIVETTDTRTSAATWWH